MPIEKPKYVNHGTYGCVMRPHVPCSKADKGHGSKDYVSKVFKERRKANEEWDMHRIVEALDPNGAFTIRLVEKCDVPLRAFPQMRKCKKWKRKHLHQRKARQLVYEYGGITLTDVPFNSDRIPLDMVLDDFVRLFRGLIVMKKKSFGHLDIKPDNIVYNPEKRKMALIDFGLATEFDDVYTYTCASMHRHSYIYYPPEFAIFFNLFRNHPTYHSEKYDAKPDLDPFLNYANMIFEPHIHKYLETCGRLEHVLDQIQKLEIMPDDTLFDATKVDVFSLGVCILDLLAEYTVVNATTERVLDVVMHMLNPDSRLRYTPEKAFTEYKKALGLNLKSSSKSVAKGSAKSVVYTPSPRPFHKKPSRKKSNKKSPPVPVDDTPSERPPVQPSVKDLGSATSVLAGSKCKPDEEYIVIVNKCLKKCKQGQVRNPETRRCKNM